MKGGKFAIDFPLLSSKLPDDLSVEAARNISCLKSLWYAKVVIWTFGDEVTPPADEATLMKLAQDRANALRALFAGDRREIETNSYAVPGPQGKNAHVRYIGGYDDCFFECYGR
jgi:hypothetical protein